MKEHTYHQYCPVACALDLVGERWSLLLLRNLFTGPKRFSDLLRGLPGISSNILTTRLRALEAAGVVHSRFLPPPAASTVYELTPAGQGLEGALIALGEWGGQFLGAPEAEQAITSESVTIMVYMLFKRLAEAPLSGSYGVTISDPHYSAQLQVGVRDEGIVVEPALPSTHHLLIRLELETLAALATGRWAFKEALTQGRVHVEGTEEARARFLRQLELAVE